MPSTCTSLLAWAAVRVMSGATGSEITGKAYTYLLRSDTRRERDPSNAFYSNGMTATWSYNADNTVHDIAYAGVTGQAYTDYDVVYGANGKPASATYSNGMSATWSYNADNTVHDIAFSGVTGQAYTSYDTVYGANGKPASATYSDGMTKTWSYDSSGVLEEVQYQNVPGKPYTTLEDDYDATGMVAISNATELDGSHIIAGHEGGLTISGTSGKDRMTGGGSDETFLFSAPFGHDTLTDFAAHVSGADHDTLSLPGAAFNNLFTQLLAATTFGKSGVGAVITVDPNDTISIPGLTKSEMQANSASFTFHS